jgi:pimeloyl-ACP methyl ester carboxylesterase
MITPANTMPPTPAPTDHAIERPSLALLATEPMRAALEFATYKLAARATTPRGDGHPVVIFPGLATDGIAVRPLRDHCRAMGYRAFDWGQGVNSGPRGDPQLWLQELAARTSELLEGSEQGATLMGWSLGGIYARELAKLMPGRVRQVITIGTPFNAERDHTNVGWLFRLLGGQEKVDPTLAAQLRSPPPVPTTSIYSRTDGIVAWQTCCHERTADRVEDIEIRGSHVGMGWNAAVFAVVADRLAQSEGGWRPFAARPVSQAAAAPARLRTEAG